MLKKFKDIVKQNPEPARGKSGNDPMDPWGAKFGLAEASEQQLLHRYLKSRGINPDYIPKDTKISHSKSSAFLSWRKSHEFDESHVSTKTPVELSKQMIDKSKRLHKEIQVESIEILEARDEKDMVCFDIPLLIRVLEFTREDMKTDVDLHNMVERLISMRETYPLTMKHYDAITRKLVKENHVAIAMGRMLDDESGMVLSQLEQLERAIGMIRSHIGNDYKKQLPAWVQAKITLATDYVDTVGNYITSKNEKVNEETLEEGRMKDIATDASETKRLNKMTTLQKFRTDASAREKKHDDIEKNSGGMTSAIDRLEKHMNKEEIEQVDELKKTTIKSWLKQQDPIPEKKPGEERKAFNVRIKKRSKSWDGALDRLTDRKPTSENTLDSQAATESPTGPGEGVTEMQRQRSKSARMIKALYKKKGMKEETYDYEKDDKNMQIAGKKPKFKDTPNVNNVGENKPDARATLTGGKTLTGEKRDDVEIDPFMNKPKNNTPDDFDKPISKKDH